MAAGGVPPLAWVSHLLGEALKGHLVAALGLQQLAPQTECCVALCLKWSALWLLETAGELFCEQWRQASRQLAHPAECQDHPVIETRIGKHANIVQNDVKVKVGTPC